MTTSGVPTFRAVSFGDLDGRSWGCALNAGVPAVGYGVDGATAAAAGPQSVRWSDESDGDWRLAGDGFELLVSATEPGSMAVAGDELCRVSGTAVVDRVEHVVDCLGIRSLGNGLDTRRFASVRHIGAWFDGDHAVSLLALRAPDSPGQEGEWIAATAFEPEGAVPVAEPRLSTTYTAGGRPSRAGLELWLGEGETQFSRRTAAEAAGAGAELHAPGLQLIATPLRCHGRGLEGAGVYMLARL